MMNELNRLKADIQTMRKKHGWDQSDNPNILAKSIVIEANELLELFIKEEIDREEVAGELADVLMYALSLAIDLDLDVSEIIASKIRQVDRRYG